MTIHATKAFLNDWSLMVLYLIGIIIVIGLSELSRKLFNWTPSTNRKIVHIMIGLIVSISPLIFRSNYPAIMLAIIFSVLNLLALKFGLLQGMHSISRKSFGTIYFPLAFLILSIFWWNRPITIVVAMSLMTFADTFAAVAGEKIRNVRNYVIWTDKKSIEGSVVMYLTSFTLVFIITFLFSHYTAYMSTYPITLIVMLAGLIAVVATISESISKYGSDNLSVPIISAIIFDQFFVSIAYNQLFAFLAWGVISLVLLWGAFKQKALSIDGTITAYLIGLIIFGAGGIQWILPLIAFFILSSLISKFRRKAEKKYSRRNIYQVLANGGVPTIIALLHFYFQLPHAYVFYLSAIAAATADTWATEIGFFSRIVPVNILTWKSVKRGDSGGITILGTFGSFAGAAAIAGCGLIFGLSASHFLIVTLAGFAGSLVDSVLGASVQGIYNCPVCEDLTEKRIHCHQETQLIKGQLWIDNNMVNLLNTVSGVLIISLLIKLI
jgi:uncharacterized protein (TIGR00297 family)